MSRRSAAAIGVSCALHVLLALLASWEPRVRPVPAGARRADAMTVVVVPPSEDSLYPGLKPVPPASAWDFPHDTPLSPLRLGGLNIDVAKIGARAAVLFPFVTPGLAVERYFPGAPPDPASRLQNPLARPRDPPPTPALNGPLELSEAALQALVDRSWARRDRWAAFAPIERLAATRDPNRGSLPSLIQRYTAQNALQPYADVAERDPRLWAQLGLAADHVDFIGFIRRYAAAHPSTKATTELLFLLDRIAEASRDALHVLLDSEPADRLTWTRDANAGAYRLITRIRRFYARELAGRGLRSEEAITRFYEEIRLQLLRGIVRTSPGGYRANDARFLIGAIYWRQQRPHEALRTWGQMTLDSTDGGIVAAPEIVAALRGRTVPDRADGAVDALLRRDVDQILKNEHNRWVAFSDDRLRRFGYRFDSF